MEEIGLPCSVITSHGEYTHGSADMLQSTSSALPYISLAPTQQHDQSKLKPEDSNSLTDVTVYEIVSVNVWPPSTAAAATILQDSVNNDTSKNDDFITLPRKRKIKRPYSPDIHIGSKRLIETRRGPRKQKRLLQKEEENLIVKSTAFLHKYTVTSIPDVVVNGKPFSCDKCHSPFIVNPARSHRLHSRRKYRPRKITDPTTKKVLLLCNACGLSMVRSKKERHKKDPPTQEEKDSYLKKAAEFAASLATSLQDPDACRLYCPAFKSSACQCLQKYISEDGKDEEGSKGRALHLLALLKEARHLTKQKNESNVELGAKSETEKQKPQLPRGIQKRRSKDFEEFVLKNRRHLREELHLCEIAAQRVLIYSNNFLHKKLKTSPNRGCRIERVNGKNARGLLKPISELANESCCSDKCVAMVLTHSKLLEAWRAIAKLGQREARRVLAEMLTPSGGTKANCYKFISMVTGCSYATICLVNDQMRRTQGEREPPEHGLKKWWRDHPKDKEKQKKICYRSNKTDNSDEDDPSAFPDVASIHIQNREELDSVSQLEASSHLQKLLEIQKQLSAQQAQVQEQLRQARLKMSKVQQLPASVEKAIPIPELTTQSSLQSKNIETVAVLTPADTNDNGGEVATRTAAQQVLHILELPTASPSVITSFTENAHPQPTISVMTSTGDFEPLTNISVSLQPRGQTTFSNVVILPESALNTSTTAAQGTSVISYSPPTEATDSMVPVISTQDPHSSGTLTSAEPISDTTKTGSSAVSTFQLYGVMDPTTPNLLHFNY